MSSPLTEDFEMLLKSEEDFNILKNKAIFITGATGLIGSLTIKALDYINKQLNLNMTILAVVRNQDKANVVLNACNVVFIEGDIKNPINYEGNIDYIIHCAAITQSKLMVQFPVENIQTAVFGTGHILDLAKNKNVKSMVYLSSMEVYGNLGSGLELVTEEQLGYLDLSDVRSSYGESKRICEMLSVSYFKEYNVPVKIVRLAQTFGAGVNINDARVFVQFAKSVMNGKDIVLHTDGSSTGNYCYTMDAIKAIFMILFRGESGHSYNVANEASHMTIKAMADLVATKVANNAISVVIDIPKNISQYGYARKVNMKLCTKKVQGLGWRPVFDMKEMYERMIKQFSYEQ